MNKEQPSRVLIVDDIYVNRKILSSLLASHGVASDLAEGGQECLDLCQKNSYDLILLDHRMPELDGVETLLKLKAMFEEAGRNIPIVCHTTEDGRKNINLYKAAGFADVLIKPIQPKLLFEILMTYLPEGAVRDANTDAEEKQRMDAEIALLPVWIRKMPELHLLSGIAHCETAEDYLDALAVYVQSIEDKARDIEQFFADANWKMYTLRVHSLKSMSYLIGANALADKAADLEDAGKREDVDRITENTPALLAEYRAFSSLKQFIFGQDMEENKNTILPSISEETLSDAYAAIRDFAECYDSESIEMVLHSLKEYHISEADCNKITAIRNALTKKDWETLRGIE